MYSQHKQSALEWYVTDPDRVRQGTSADFSISWVLLCKLCNSCLSTILILAGMGRETTSCMGCETTSCSEYQPFLNFLDWDSNGCQEHDVGKDLSMEHMCCKNKSHRLYLLEIVLAIRICLWDTSVLKMLHIVKRSDHNIFYSAMSMRTWLCLVRSCCCCGQTFPVIGACRHTFTTSDMMFRRYSPAE